MIYMEIFGPLLISSIAGLSTIIGGFFTYIKIRKDKINSFITFCLSFSLSIMILISILDLIPSASYIIIMEKGITKGIIISIFLFIISILIINFINKKIESYNPTTSNLYRVGILSMVAMMIHNFPEGIATFMSAYKDINLGISLGIAIMLHNIPEGIAISIPLYYATKKRALAFKKTLISGLTEPLGAILAYLFLSKYINDLFISYVLIIVSGIMISIAINKLLPEVISYNKPKYIYLGIIIGIILSLINHFFF